MPHPHLYQYINFGHSKQGKLQKRGKINLIGRLQLTTEKTRDEDNEGIVQLRILRTQVSGRGFGLVNMYTDFLCID